MRTTPSSLRRFVAIASLFIAVLGGQGRAHARERVAVLILVEDQLAAENPALADNLTEIAIAELAEGHDRELLGGRDLRQFLANAAEGGGLAGCVARASCLARLGEQTGASRAVVGVVERRGKSFALTMTLTQTKTSVQEAKVVGVADDQAKGLIEAARQSLSALFDLKQPSLLASSPARAAKTTAAVDLSPHVSDRSGSRSLVKIGGGAAAGLAVVSFSAAAVLGSLAQQPPEGASRSARQIDLEGNVREARMANGLLLTGAALAAISVAVFVWTWRQES